MKTTNFISGVSLFLSFLFFWTTISSAQCDECSHPRVGLYDAQMLVPKPSGTGDSIVGWWTLQWPMAIVRATITASDPTRDCITWYSGAVVNARDLQGNRLHIGVEYYHLPPGGEVAGADYLLTGTVSGSGGSFTLTVTLETAVVTRGCFFRVRRLWI